MTHTPAMTPQLDGDAELRLPRPPGVFRRWLAAHPRIVDGSIVVAYLFGSLLMVVADAFMFFGSEQMAAIDPTFAEESTGFATVFSLPRGIIAFVITVVVALALAFRRRYPLAGTIVIAALVWIEIGPLGIANAVALAFLLYAVPVYRSVRAGWLAYGIVTVAEGLRLTAAASFGSFMSQFGLALAAEDMGVAELSFLFVLTAITLLAVLMVGINMGNRKRYVTALIDRARQLALEREQRAALAAAAERARIAREMHDIVAHSLSVVVTLSEAASVAIEAQPEAAKQAMDRAAETGRTALTEMRRLLGVLTEPADAAGRSSPTLAPQPGVAQIADLVAGFVEAGLRVAVTEQGVPAGDAAQQLAVYRIVQESLTNALRHAGGSAAVTVHLGHTPRGTAIDVIDTGPGAADAARAPRGRRIPGAGRGLAGAAQRAAVFGGSVQAAPFGSGWRVTANVPVDPREGQERTPE